MTTEPTPQMLTIPMSERDPVEIDPRLWRVIATATRPSPDKHAESLASIAVRQGADGRRIVYGGRFVVANKRRTAGFVVEPGGDTVRAIRRVAGILASLDLADECIAKLPAVSLDGPTRTVSDAETKLTNAIQCFAETARDALDESEPDPMGRGRLFRTASVEAMKEALDVWTKMTRDVLAEIAKGGAS